LNKNESSVASRIISDTVDAGFIKPADVETTSKKYMTYIPFYRWFFICRLNPRWRQVADLQVLPFCDTNQNSKNYTTIIFFQKKEKNLYLCMLSGKDMKSFPS